MNPAVSKTLPVRELVAAFRNPHHVILDRIGLRHAPYVLRTRDGLKMRIRPGPGDRFAAFEIFGLHAYTSLGERLNQGDVVVDVGANIGCYSVLAAKAVGPKGRVIAVEPSGATYACLLHNLSLNGLQNVSCRHAAVADQTGEAVLHIGNDPLFASLWTEVAGHKQSGATETVATISLRDLMAAEGLSRIDMLKMDCEGAEHAIIAGIDGALAGRIAQISLELHPLPGQDGTAAIAHLRSLGYRVRQGETWYFDRPQDSTASAP